MDALISCILVKVASRCNLDCDYCYVYQHADQTWKNQPKFISELNIHLLGRRLKEYSELTAQKRFLIVFHGGEPLLWGVNAIVECVQKLHTYVGEEIELSFSLQTNGTLLTLEACERFDEYSVGVSLSLDGPQWVNDLHRLDHKGKSTHAKTENALKLLASFPNIWTGVISVIDPRVEPIELFEYFSRWSVPSLDFLLPDGNWNAPPKLKDQSPNIYIDWLTNAFLLWFDKYSSIEVRTFDNILAAVSGINPGTDSFGFGDISMLTIETDGSYHGLDVLKVTREAESSFGRTLSEDSFVEVIRSNIFSKHRNLLTFEGLGQKCQECPEVNHCGGGSVPHRFDGNDFHRESVYCEELKTLFRLARGILKDAAKDSDNYLSSTFTIDRIIDADSVGTKSFFEIFQHWQNLQAQKVLDVLTELSSVNSKAAVLVNKYDSLDKRLLTLPSIVLWSNVTASYHAGISTLDLDGDVIAPDINYIDVISNIVLNKGDLVAPLIQREDRWLRSPFGSQIKFESSENTEKLSTKINAALKLINEWNPKLHEEISLASPEIQLIIDPDSDPNKAVSFSDNILPGALFIAAKSGNVDYSIPTLADSILHEHRHQKLYILQSFNVLVEDDSSLVNSPWREDLRPPSGLLHALFVFVCLYEFWTWLSKYKGGIYSSESENVISDIKGKLDQGFYNAASASYTENGYKLLDHLKKRYHERV